MKTGFIFMKSQNMIKTDKFCQFCSVYKKNFKNYKTYHGQLTISDQNFFYNTDRIYKIFEKILKI